jgi:hypothetical protein
MGTRPVLMVDFNDLDENRQVPALLVLENEHVKPSIGDIVELRDEEGNAVEGYVVEVDSQIATVDPEWSRWRTTKEIVFTKTGEATAADLAEVLLSVAHFSVPSGPLVR